MKLTDIKKLYSQKQDFQNTEVEVGGWVRSVRDNKNFGFIDLNDGTCFKGVQVIFTPENCKNYDEIAKLNAGSSIRCVGTFVLTPENKQPFEIKAKNVEIISKTGIDYPLQKKGHSLEFLREQAYLRPRTNLFNAVFRVRSEVAFAIHSFFKKEGFVYTHTPILTGADCEGGSDVFRVTTHNFFDKEKMKNATPENDFFGKKVFLTPTGQLEGEALALAFSRIYTFGPTFRAENSNTTRHASEFWMIEPEMAFYDLKDNMELIEKMVKYLIQYMFENCPDELEFFNSFVDKDLKERLNHVLVSEFVRLPYTKAIEILEKVNDRFEYKVSWGIDLQSEHERYLTEQVYKKPVFLTDFPRDFKAFYMRLNEDKKTVAACDLLVPNIGEIVGGSQREERLDTLLEQIKFHNLKEKDYEWYINLRKYGGVVHSGFGLGFERILMYLTGISNIRDVEIFPRTPKNCEY
ncbi:MAG: asparagine--tRNA ligase [Clostridia bacterium]|nr:asparagine--tRNA ligase [Clostridia bacterium]